MEHKGSGLPGLSRVVSNDRSRSSSNASTTTVFSFTKQEVNCASPRHNISIFSQVIENAPPPTIIDTKAPVELKTVRQERTFSVTPFPSLPLFLSYVQFYIFFLICWLYLTDYVIMF